MLTLSCVLLLETCKLGLIESCIIMASNYVIYPWNCIIFTYAGTEDDTIVCPLVTHWWDLTSWQAQWSREWTQEVIPAKRPPHLGISQKKYTKRQFEACWNLLGIQISAFRATYYVLKESSDNWKQFVGYCFFFFFALLPDSSKLSEYNRIGMWCLFHLLLQPVWPV